MATFDNSATNQNYQHLYKSTPKLFNNIHYSNFGRRCWCRQNSYCAQVNQHPSHLLLRYVKGKLPMNKPSTIGVEFATKNVELKNNQGIVKAQIWDTGNLHTYSYIFNSWSREIQGNHLRVRIPITKFLDTTAVPWEHLSYTMSQKRKHFTMRKNGWRS
jgi:hypothetical protein